MHTLESQLVILRFFKALDLLKSRRQIRGLNTFTTKYNINRWNLISLRKNPNSGTFEPSWMTFLVKDYNISAHWLLTGDGEPINGGMILQ